MNVLRINGYNWTSPAGYNELDVKQLLQVCRLLLIGEMAGRSGALYNHDDIRSRLLCVLLGVRKGLLRHSKKVKSFLRIPTEAKIYLMYDEDVTGWVYKPANLTAYTIREFTHKGKTYYGPHDGILNISVAEFIESVMYFGAYQDSMKNNPKTDLLDKMIAVLYRPGRLFYQFEKFGKDFSLDRRKVKNEYRFEKWAKAFAKMPEELKLAIFLQYEGALSSFAKNFPKSFGKKKGKGDLNGWIKLLMSMSNDIFGNFEQTQKTDAYTFFTKVEQNIEVADRAKLNLK